jgi:16S rRNA (guanine527-N7)-methyltransferase
MSLPDGRTEADRRQAADNRRGRAGQPRRTATGPTTGDASAAALRVTLADGAGRLGVPLASVQIERLLRFRTLLEKWNRVYNLTALHGAQAVAVGHLLDSLAIIPALRRREASVQRRPLRILDAGSGPGLPGVVVAIALPGAEVCCVDAAAKKAAFIRHAAAELGLDNLRAEHARVEALDAGRFDIVVARALSSLGEFVRLTRHLVAPAGAWLAMKGRLPSEEMAALPPDVEVFHVEPIEVPGTDAARCLVWLRTK